MALGSIEPLKEMSTKISPGWYRWPVHMADNLATFMCRMARNSGSLNFPEPYRLLQACNGITSICRNYNNM
jgi:hypothetical protein